MIRSFQGGLNLFRCTVNHPLSQNDPLARSAPRACSPAIGGIVHLPRRQLDRIRDRLIATGRKADAAWVSLDVVMLLGDDGRHEEAARLAISLLETFAKLGLPAEAMRALEELRDAATQGTMTPELLAEIQERPQKV